MTEVSECKKETPKTTRPSVHGETNVYVSQDGRIIFTDQAIAGPSKRLLTLGIVDQATGRVRSMEHNEVDGTIKGADIQRQDFRAVPKLAAEIKAAAQRIVECGDYDPAAKLVNAMHKPVQPASRHASKGQ